MLKKVLNPKKCAECRICCSFVEADKWETPLFSKDLAEVLKSKNIKVKQVGDKYTFILNFENDKQIKLCPFLDEMTGCNLKESEKPFDCKIWPLRPMQKNGKIVIGLAEVCPNFKDNKEGIRKLLEDGLYEQIMEFANSNPDNIKKFDNSYEVFK